MSEPVADSREPEVTPGPRPPLVPTGRNGGRLYAGGVPGNRGGLGRPPSAVVRQANEDLKGLLARLREAANNPRTPVRDLVQIARLMVEVSDREGGPPKPETRIRVLSATVESIGPALEAERAAEQAERDDAEPSDDGMRAQ